MLGRSIIRQALSATLALCVIMGSAHRAGAETTSLRIAQQFGSASLPLLVMQHEKLIEKYAAESALPLTVQWLTFSGGNVMNDALLSGSLDIATTGLTPLLTIWDKTRSSIKVRGLASLGSVPFVLVSTNPAVKSVTDLGPKDRVAVPAAKVSIQAVVMQMAAAKAFGEAEAFKLDVFTASMKHPDAVAALVGGGTEINGHVSSSPYYEYELANAKDAHLVMSSLDVAGPATNVAICATTKFYEANPKVIEIVMRALDDAMDIINKDHAKATRIYKEVTGEKYSEDFLQNAIFGSKNVFTKMPEGVEKFGAFMKATGRLKEAPASWKDVFFPVLDRPGH